MNDWLEFGNGTAITRCMRKPKTYIVALGIDGVIGSKPMRMHKMMDSLTAITFLSELLPGKHIYQQLERAPRGARQVWVYWSPNKEGNGRIGRNWEPLMVES